MSLDLAKRSERPGVMLDGKCSDDAGGDGRF